MSKKGLLDSTLESELGSEWKKARSAFAAQLAGIRGPGLDRQSRAIEHDAQALGAVQTLRDHTPNQLLPQTESSRFEKQEIPINSPFWLVTFDSSLRDLHESGSDPGETLPLTLFFSAVISLYDPYVMARYLRDISDEEVRAPYVRSREDVVRVVQQAKEKYRVAESVRKMVERVNEYAVEGIA